ncbi:hypothetical protein [Microbacterium lushaniae]|uniref:Uncharacterized protein n=1 Tax=Microbacterium lushaniae TaxID=2614639 RepID=A0A5J6L560_9MICO|nr:hypothetical protein [Microbacterium lushaniae]QEW03515.1 hypothetical protein F6J85_10650 [Microbacterium lushaniae]
MSVSLRRLAIKTAAAVGLAGALTLGGATMASASEGELIVVDTGTQCVVFWQTADGAITHWWNTDNTWIAL